MLGAMGQRGTGRGIGQPGPGGRQACERESVARYFGVCGSAAVSAERISIVSVTVTDWDAKSVNRTGQSVARCVEM